ncbi:MAG: SCO family protein [Pseudomonadota bacterium]
MPSTATYAWGASGIVAVGLLAGGWFALQPSDALAECGGGIATGAATIGGPFELVNSAGLTVTEKQVIDKPTLIYFGYTFCPDVCPMDVAVMGQAVEILQEGGREVGSAFITIDPERDTTEVVGEFASAMHDDMIGLTGSDAQIEAAADAYKVYYAKVEGDDPEYYLVDHSAFTYLMDPGSGFLQVYRHGEPPEAIAESVACFYDALGA